MENRDFESSEDTNLSDFGDDGKLVESAAKLSEKVFEKIWDNDEDSVYDDLKLP